MKTKFKIIENKDPMQVNLPKLGAWPESIHQFDEDSIWAINAALTSGRPLLIRGEPGTGKSQLARAAAQILGRAFISEVVYAHSECRDLLWKFDAVARLGEAQAIVACKQGENIDEKLSYKRFLTPGCMWWAFDWASAKKQAKECAHSGYEPQASNEWQEENGCVLLIDEIDKADTSLPNGLLEVFGNGAFRVPYMKKEVGLKEPQPLVIITTNEERELPNAFLRRCMVLHMKLPKGDELIKWLIERGRLHFENKCEDSVYEEAAKQLVKDRDKALNIQVPAPGQAEYLDMLRALVQMSDEENEQLEILGKIKKFALEKYLE
ncbi:AAA family ATPase [Candidatus Uabimicrobium sp. HlEnr_7]|uniref:AAA family ATPase n=1 Tax=Candidatus Uabimicrobium helgolandensis TaxID=3095367 RepID=UPI003557D20E